MLNAWEAPRLCAPLTVPPPSAVVRPTLRIRTWMFVADVDEAAWMTKLLPSELVAWIKILSLEDRGTLLVHATMAVVEAAIDGLVVGTQIPTDASVIVLAVAPTFKAVVLAVPKTVRSPWVAIAPVDAVVVALPLTVKLPYILVAPVIAAVDDAKTLPPVVILVEIVVEALTAIVTKRTPATTATTIVIKLLFLINENTLFIIMDTMLINNAANNLNTQLQQGGPHDPLLHLSQV